jgi:hypothetical protein
VCRNPIHIWNDLSEFAKVNEKLDEFAEQFGVPPAIAATFHIIFDDLLNNVISYGFNDEQRHFLDISLELTANSLIVSITDDGVPFNPLTETAIESNLDTHVRFPVNETVSKSSFWRLRFADGTLPADLFQAVVWSFLVVFVDPIACDLAHLAQ